MHEIRLKVLRFSNVLSYGSNVNEVYFGDGLTWIKGPNGAGKAQPLNSMICTPNGFIKMGDIEINQLVSNPDGTNSRVIGIYPQGMVDVYKITLADGSIVECSDEHLWKGYFTGCKHTDGVYTTLEIIQKWQDNKHLKGNHYKGFVLPNISPVIFNSSSELPISPYTMGVLLGDGSFRGGNVSLSSTESHILDRVSSEIVKYGCKFGNASQNNTYSIKSIEGNGKWYNSHNNLKNTIVDLGLFNKYSSVKFIPDIYKYSSVNERLDLLQGLMDTDGYVSKNGQVFYYTTSTLLRDGVKFLVESLGGYVNISSKIGKYTKHGITHECKTIYNIYIKLSNVDTIISLPRKRERLTKQQNYNRTIKSIDYMGKRECQCIRVDNPNHLYLTDNFIPTHNSSIIEAINFALFSTSFRAMKKGDLRNTSNKGKLKVYLEFEREDSKGTHSYAITREMGKSSTKTLFEKDDIEQNKEAGYSQKVLEEEILGFNQSIFENVISLNTIETTPFIDMDPAKKRKLIESMLTLQIDKFKDANKKALKEAQTKMESAKSDVVKYEKDVLELEEMIVTLKKEHAGDIDDLKEQIGEHKNSINEYKVQQADKQNEYDALTQKGKDKLTELNEFPDYSSEIDILRNVKVLQARLGEISDDRKDKYKLSKASIVKFETAKTEFEKLPNVTIADIKSKRLELEKLQSMKSGYEGALKLTDEKRVDIERKGKELKAGVECPTCNKPSTEDDIESLRKEYRVQWKGAKDAMGIHKTGIDSYGAEIKLLKPEIEQMELDLAAYTKGETAFSTAKTEMKRLKKEYDTLNDDYIERSNILSDTDFADKSVDELDLKITETKAKKIEYDLVEAEIGEIRSDVRALKKDISNFDSNISNTEKSIDVIEAKITKKKMQSGDDSISLMENKIKGTQEDFNRAKTRVTKYSDEISITKYIETMYDDDGIKKIVLGIFVPNLNKAVAHNLNLFNLAFMLEFDDGMDYRFESRFGLAPSYNSLSQGQKRKLNFAIAVAFRDFVTSIADFKINILFLDEVLDISTDEEALENMIQLLKNKVPEIGGIYLMTHRGEQFADYFDNCIQVENDGRYSSLEMKQLPKTSNY